MNFLAMYDESSPLGELLSVIPVTGVLIVFFMLVLLVLIIAIFGAVMNKGKPKPVKEKPRKVDYKIEAVCDNDEIIAVIAAAVDAMYEGTGKSAVIRAIRPSIKSKGKRNSWSQSGVSQNVKAF